MIKKLTVFITLMCILLCNVSCNDTPERWIKEAQKHLRKNEFEKGIECFDKALALDPENVYSLYWKGKTLGALERNQEAFESLDKATELDPQHIEAWKCKGIVLYNLKRFEESLICFEKALEINSNDKDSKSGREQALDALDKKDDEIVKACTEGNMEEVKKLLKEDPNLINAKDWNGETPLHKAAINGHVELVKLLLEEGANPNALSYEGIYPIDWTKSEEIKEILIKHGAKKGK